MMMTMSESRVHFHFFSLLLLCCVSPSSLANIKFTKNDPALGQDACRHHQIQALMQFKNEFDSSGCNENNYFQEIYCDNTTGAITKLQLPSGCLTGILKPSSSLFGFHHLRYLNLSHNNFISSSLPSEFGNLNKLEVLSLSSNGFFGQVPSSFSNLSLLSQLDLSHNELTGSFPLVQNLSKLSFLKLSYNHLSGTLNPNSNLFEMNNLRYLNLAFNNFSSKLPSELGNLNKLEVLSLSSNGFFGQVPPTISNLTSLTQLYLHQNEFTGSFPLVQNLTKVVYLELSNNHLSGTIPFSLLTMPYLTYLDLNENHLTGPVEVPNSSKMKLLSLGHNQFDEQILEPISKLINLEDLYLSFLNTSYPVDISLFSSFKYLTTLDLSGNSISPASLKSYTNIPPNLRILTMSLCGFTEFPNFIKTLKYLEFIDISNNRIKGKIPEWLWKLPRLTTVNVLNNSFTGFEGSAEVLENSSVIVLDVAENSFEGTLPDLPLSINAFTAEINGFTGNIPLSICNRSSLTTLSLSYNNFTGPVPQCFSNFMFLNLRKNNLNGSLPDVVNGDASLRALDIGYNRLTGKLPRSLINCSSLEFLSVDNNNIEDTFPFWLKALPNLMVLTLRSNKFYGSISPPHQGPLGFPELKIFEISDNKFTGSLPPNYFVNWKATTLKTNEDVGIYMEHHQNPQGTTVDLSYKPTIDLRYKGLSMEQQGVLTFYSTIDLSGNKFEGQIPESIGLLKALIALNLSNNAFTGHIPQSLANLKELESLDLSRNQLSGTIPNGLKTLSFLAYVSMSHNNLKGEIPQGTQITGQSKSSFEGNAGLCGLPLEESCFGASAPPIQQHKQDEDEEEEEEEEEEKVLNWKAVAISYAPGVLFGLAVTQLIVSYKPLWLAKIIGLN